MSALTSQLRGGHVFAWGPTTDGGAVPSCTCQPGVRVDDWPAHLIAVTEFATRAQIALDLDTARTGVHVRGNWDRGVRYGLTIATDITKGGA